MPGKMDFLRPIPSPFESENPFRPVAKPIASARIFQPSLKAPRIRYEASGLKAVSRVVRGIKAPWRGTQGLRLEQIAETLHRIPCNRSLILLSVQNPNESRAVVNVDFSISNRPPVFRCWLG